MADLYLASRSPRRRELLKQIGVRFEPLLIRLASPRAVDVDEVQHANEPADRYVERIAHEKAEHGVQVLALRSMLPKPVLAADTVVILDGEVLGKPVDKAQATDFLRRLSGRTHEVRTAVALGLTGGGTFGSNARVLRAVSVSSVTFRSLEASEIERYLATGDPFDKAGGYGIQSLAAVFVERLEGSYTGVMGLPLFETAQLLKQAGVPVV
jgi:septum formation protein